MIEHVYRRCLMVEGIQGVFIATCDVEIQEAAAAFGAPVIMTSSAHQRASDRVAEAMETIKTPVDVVVMVQGDEPMLDPSTVSAALAPFRQNKELKCVNLMKRLTSKDEIEDRNTIKVVSDLQGNALYLSREPVPTLSLVGINGGQWYKQVCVIPFTVGGLKEFAALSPTPLEVAESIDMLRFLEHGVPVQMVETTVDTHAVDTPEDLAMVERLLEADPLTRASQMLRKG